MRISLANKKPTTIAKYTFIGLVLIHFLNFYQWWVWFIFGSIPLIGIYGLFDQADKKQLKKPEFIFIANLLLAIPMMLVSGSAYRAYEMTSVATPKSQLQSLTAIVPSQLTLIHGKTKRGDIKVFQINGVNFDCPLESINQQCDFVVQDFAGKTATIFYAQNSQKPSSNHLFALNIDNQNILQYEHMAYLYQQNRQENIQSFLISFFLLELPTFLLSLWVYNSIKINKKSS